MALKDVNSLSPDEIENLSDADFAAYIAQANGENKDESDTGEAAAETKTQAASSATTEEGEQAQDENETAAGILAKDGKSIIPIEVLQNTRQQLTQVNSTLNETQQKLSSAEAELAQLREKVNSQSDIQFEGEHVFTDEELEVLEEDMPELAAKIRKAQDIAAKAQTYISRQEEKAEHDARTQAARVAQDAIDQVPKLAYLQATNPDLFEMAKTMDSRLRADPANKDLTLTQRFEKAVAMVETAIGTEIKLPNAPGGKKQIQIKDNTQVTSLDDIHGGEAPVNDEIMNIVNKSPTELAAMMDGMSDVQMDAWLARAMKAIA